MAAAGVVLLGSTLALFPGPPAPAEVAVREVRLLVDPALAGSGLPAELARAFEEARGVRVRLQALPSKEALELGASGEADLVWVHAPRLEVQYLNQGFYLDRRRILYTEHVLVGPAADAAGVRGQRRVVLAFRRIAQLRAPFVSPGDGSPSFELEQELWKKARITPRPPWYIRAGVDPAGALAVAASQGAYLLLDRSVAASLPAAGPLGILVEGEHSLRREYHVLAVNPHRFPKVNHDDARALVEFLLSAAGQEQIRRFGTPSGRPAFFPGVGKAPADPEGSGKETR